MSDLVEHGQLGNGRVTIHLDGNVLADALGLDAGLLAPECLTFDAPFDLRRRGVETRIVVGDPVSGPDRTLIRGLARGHEWAAALLAGTPISTIARRAGVSEAYIRPRVRLAFLSPRIQTVILEGRQPADLTLERLVRRRLPLAWSAQERMLGFPTD